MYVSPIVTAYASCLIDVIEEGHRLLNISVDIILLIHLIIAHLHEVLDAEHDHVMNTMNSETWKCCAKVLLA